MHITWLKFIVCAGLIFFAGRRVARNADVIAEKTGLGGLWIGVVLVAVTTSLPELFTGIGSVIFVDAPDLTVGNIFGANSYNLLNLGFLDMLTRGGPLLVSLSSGQLLTAALTLIPIMLAAAGIMLSGSGFHVWSVGGIGLFSIAIVISYGVITKIIYNFEKRENTKIKSTREKETLYDRTSLKTAYIRFFLAAAVIVMSGIWLAYIGKDLSLIMGLKQSFIGSLFIGFATTLPEITVSAAALFMGAREIAVANMLGSNLFNVVIIFINDVLYRKAPILEAVSTDHLRQAFCVMAMTTVVILAMATKSKKKFFNVSWYVPLLIIIFLASAYLNFKTGR